MWKPYKTYLKFHKTLGYEHYQKNTDSSELTKKGWQEKSKDIWIERPRERSIWTVNNLQKRFKLP